MKENQIKTYEETILVYLNSFLEPKDNNGEVENLWFIKYVSDQDGGNFEPDEGISNRLFYQNYPWDKTLSERFQTFFYKPLCKLAKETKEHAVELIEQQIKENFLEVSQHPNFQNILQGLVLKTFDSNDFPQEKQERLLSNFIASSAFYRLVLGFSKDNDEKKKKRLQIFSNKKYKKPICVETMKLIGKVANNYEMLQELDRREAVFLSIVEAPQTNSELLNNEENIVTKKDKPEEFVVEFVKPLNFSHIKKKKSLNFFISLEDVPQDDILEMPIRPKTSKYSNTNFQESLIQELTSTPFFKNKKKEIVYETSLESPKTTCKENKNRELLDVESEEGLLDFKG